MIVTLTKDDLNHNGSRADFSERNLQIARSDRLPEAEWLMLRRARSNLRAYAIELIHSLHKHPAPPQRKVGPYDGTPLTADFSAYVALIKNYEFDADAWSGLRDVCEHNGLPPPIIVMMPVTDQNSLFHDRLVEKPKTSRIRHDVQDVAQAGQHAVARLHGRAGSGIRALSRPVPPLPGRAGDLHAATDA